MAGKGTKRWHSVFTMAAPVGVTSSASTPEEYTGAPRNNSTVAGEGTGNLPCAQSTVPPPTLSGEQTHSSTPNARLPTDAQTISTIASTAPTSWKWILSTSQLWIFASA